MAKGAVLAAIAGTNETINPVRPTLHLISLVGQNALPHRCLPCIPSLWSGKRRCLTGVYLASHLFGRAKGAASSPVSGRSYRIPVCGVMSLSVLCRGRGRGAASAAPAARSASRGRRRRRRRSGGRGRRGGLPRLGDPKGP